jgi:hypothetical protein
MFVAFPTAAAEGSSARQAIDTEDVRRIIPTGTNTTTLLLDNHAGGLDHFRVRMSMDGVIRMVNEAKMGLIKAVENAQGGAL